MANSKNFEELPIKDQLKEKINIYYHSIWREKWQEQILENWLGNFKEEEEINVLYLLSKFMYFGNLEIREILRSIYRDLFQYPIIEEIRKRNSDTLDLPFLNSEFHNEALKTRFLGVGNPSESGVHILYYFRQENDMHKDDFIYVSDIFKGVSKKDGGRDYIELELRDEDVSRYIFIDDFCGSGNQAKDYLLDDLRVLKKLKPDCEINYFMMFGTDHGIQCLKNLTVDDASVEKLFKNVESIFVLDDSFKVFSDDSRYYKKVSSEITKDDGYAICESYGKKLIPPHPLGYKDGQLLISFFHNTPDNALPIFWCSHSSWIPIFKRYNKIY